MASSGGAKPPRKPKRLPPKSSAEARAGSQDDATTKKASSRSKSLPAVPADDPAPAVAAGVNILRVDPGIYVLQIGKLDGPSREIAGLTLPITHIGAPSRGGAGIEVVASYPQRGPWFGPAGGTAVINVPAGGGQIVVTSYGEPGQVVSVPAAELRRLDQLDSPAISSTTAAGLGRSAAGEKAAREIPTEILLHIERAGDRLFAGRGWVGALGRKLRVEGFSIRPLERIQPGEIEFKGFEPNGQETPWVNAGTLCGTRGRGLPLTGFAVRLAAHLRERFDAVYEGSFFSAGIVGPNRNGEPCRSAVGDDPLEAINVRLIEKADNGARPNPAGR